MATTRVFYKGKKELRMAQFEALASLDDAVDYDITDFPNGGITNAQMTAALGYSRLFEDGEIYVCSDNGTYTKGHTYQVKVTSGVKSWEDITDGIKIYAMTDTLNDGSIKSGTFTEEQINNIKLADILQVYCIDGDPVSKYAYKGLYPTNPAQSTIGANLYFVAATEKGNYVLAINTDTRNWEVREPASGDLQNYVPTQSELTNGAKVYSQVTNENGAVSIRVFENGDADLQNISVTKDGVTINGKKPLTSIQPLYKHELVIPYSFSVTDPANGTATVNGSVMYHYLSNSGTQITSASAIDDNFMLSGGIGKNSANTVLLFDVNVTKAGSSITVEAVSASTMGYITGTVGAISDTVMQLI